MADDGIIFYTSDLNKQDLIAVYILGGKVRKYFPSNGKVILQIIFDLGKLFFQVYYKFDCGSGPALLVSNKTINDNQWHNVIFKRQGNYGQLIVDEEKVTGYSLGRTTAININPPFFVGGILPEISNIVNTNIVRWLDF